MAKVNRQSLLGLPHTQTGGSQPGAGEGGDYKRNVEGPGDPSCLRPTPHLPPAPGGGSHSGEKGPKRGLETGSRFKIQAPMSLCACACRLVKPDFRIDSVRERPLEAGSQAHFRFMSGGRDLKPQTFGERGGWAGPVLEGRAQCWKDGRVGPVLEGNHLSLGLAPTKDDFP